MLHLTQELQMQLKNYLETEVEVGSTYHSQRQKILKLLKRNEFVPTSWLTSFAPQYNARIYELRHGKHNGFCYLIISVRNDGKYGYRLEGWR